MEKNAIVRYKSLFDDITQYIEGEDGKVKVWFARDLMPILQSTKSSRWTNDVLGRKYSVFPPKTRVPLRNFSKRC